MSYSTGDNGHLVAVTAVQPDVINLFCFTKSFSSEIYHEQIKLSNLERYKLCLRVSNGVGGSMATNSFGNILT